MRIAALVPLIAVVLAFQAYCVIDLVRSPSTRHLPKWAWALVCLAVNPMGGVLYLLVGREPR